MSFSGLNEDFYSFLWELAFHNDVSFFEANRARYKKSVYEPLSALALTLAPHALCIDDTFATRSASVISRIRRDTRYSLDKSPYRDHAWLGYRRNGERIGVSFTVYAEFERESYGYGMGMYAPDTAMMNALRERMLAHPSRFLELVSNEAFVARFSREGQAFKRPRYLDAPKELQPWLNMRNLSFCFSSPRLQDTLRPELADEIIEAFALMKPVYRFLMGLDS